MIKFFRRIRQRLLSENKLSKYLLYAIGEIVLVVIGILIALQINNWNEERKLEDQRQQLISSLLEDFEYNRDFIRDDRLPAVDKLLQDAQLFFELIKEDTPVVSVDSLRHLARAFFRGASFHPNLTSLNEAASSGKLSLLNNKTLLIAFNRFEQEDEVFQKIADEGTYNFYNGASWELRRTVPPNFLAGTNSMPNISYADYKKVVDSTLAQTTFYNSRQLVGVKRNTLEDMLEISKEIISLLKKMQEQ